MRLSPCEHEIDFLNNLKQPKKLEVFVDGRVVSASQITVHCIPCDTDPNLAEHVFAFGTARFGDRGTRTFRERILVP